jgi:hypothetical protein
MRKFSEGLAMVLMFSLIAIIALTFLAITYIIRGCYGTFILGKIKMSRLRDRFKTSRGDKHNRGSPFM